jgi:release factor glutamine methyltransferase
MRVTIQETLILGHKRLSKAGIPTSLLDAHVLLAYVLGIPRERLYIEHQRLLSQEDLSAFEGLLDLRCCHVPVAYITGIKEFYGINFRVTPGVLVPRPETEFVVEQGLKFLRGVKAPLVADLCCGSGIIGISLAVNNPGVRVYASDISEAAREVTLENARALGVEHRVAFLQGDLWKPFDHRGLKDFDLVVSNPPYIPTGEIEHLSEDVKHEPKIALDGGGDGVNFYRAIVEDAPKYLKPRGKLILEIGYDQASAVADLLSEAGFEDIEVIRDYAGLDRVVSAVAMS